MKKKKTHAASIAPIRECKTCYVGVWYDLIVDPSFIFDDHAPKRSNYLYRPQNMTPVLVGGYENGKRWLRFLTVELKDGEKFYLRKFHKKTEVSGWETTIRCPKCQTPYTVDIATVVEAIESPRPSAFRTSAKLEANLPHLYICLYFDIASPEKTWKVLFGKHKQIEKRTEITERKQRLQEFDDLIVTSFTEVSPSYVHQFQTNKGKGGCFRKATRWYCGEIRMSDNRAVFPTSLDRENPLVQYIRPYHQGQGFWRPYPKNPAFGGHNDNIAAWARIVPPVENYDGGCLFLIPVQALNSDVFSSSPLSRLKEMAISSF